MVTAEDVRVIIREELASFEAHILDKVRIISRDAAQNAMNRGPTRYGPISEKRREPSAPFPPHVMDNLSDP